LLIKCLFLSDGKLKLNPNFKLHSPVYTQYAEIFLDDIQCLVFLPTQFFAYRSLPCILFNGVFILIIRPSGKLTEIGSESQSHNYLLVHTRPHAQTTVKYIRRQRITAYHVLLLWRCINIIPQTYLLILTNRHTHRQEMTVLQA
jgi:hypothetical protein